MCNSQFTLAAKENYLKQIIHGNYYYYYYYNVGQYCYTFTDNIGTQGSVDDWDKIRRKQVITVQKL